MRVFKIFTVFILFGVFLSHVHSEEKEKTLVEKETVSKSEEEKGEQKPEAEEEFKGEEEQLDKLSRQKEEPRLSNKWYRGNYLIYDCEKGFFACVNRGSYEQCRNQRETRLDERVVQLGCTPFKGFKNQKECFDVQYQKMHNQLPHIYCIHPKFR